MASTKAGSSSRALSLALERDESRWKPCCKRSSSRDESRDRSPRGALVIIAAKLPDGRPTGGYRELPSGKQSSQVVKNPISPVIRQTCVVRKPFRFGTKSADSKWHSC